MSVQDVVKYKSAYERMLEDGTAFKEVDMTMHTEPSVEMASAGIGDRVNESKQNPVKVQERNDNYEEFDSVMEQRISSLRSKMKGGKTSTVGRIMTPAQKEIETLKKRIDKLEEALIIIMQTQEQLLE